MNELPKPPKLPGGRRHDEVFNPRKLFVGGLSKETTQKQFKAYWQQWGELEDCVVMIDPHTQKSRGFGFVAFASQQIASEILSRSESLTMYGRKLDIKKAVPRSNPPPASHQRQPSLISAYSHPAHHVYDSRIAPPSASASYYPQYPPMYPPHTRARPYAPSYAAPNHHNVSSVSRESVARSHSRRTRNRKREKLFVGGLAETFTDRTLHSYFSKYGQVQDSIVMFDKEGNSRRFGFVTFVNSDNVDRVLNDGKHAINGVNVTIERAIPKDQLGNSSVSRKERAPHSRDYDRYPSRYDDPYYPPPAPMYRHKGPPPPPIYSPPVLPTHHPQPYAPRVSPHAAPHFYLPPPQHPYPPSYYQVPPVVPTTSSATRIHPPQPAPRTTAGTRYQYRYPQNTAAITTPNASKQAIVSRKSESKTMGASAANCKPRKAITMQSVSDTNQAYAAHASHMQSARYPAQPQPYAKGAPSTKPHVPAPNHGVYRATAYPNVAQYGAYRGGVAATRTYRPY